MKVHVYSTHVRVPPEAANFFLWKSDCLGCVVRMTLLASFFLPSVYLMNICIIIAFDTEKNAHVIPDDSF